MAWRAAISLRYDTCSQQQVCWCLARRSLLLLQATERGIWVSNIPSDTCANALSCAELAIYLLLGLLRQANEMRRSIQSQTLGWPLGQTLFGKRVLIVGFGGIARELVPRQAWHAIGCVCHAAAVSCCSLRLLTCTVGHLHSAVEVKGSRAAQAEALWRRAASGAAQRVERAAPRRGAAG